MIIEGNINVGNVKVYPELEDLEVTPTNKEQVFTHEGSYGYDNVKVKAIDIQLQDKSVTPSKEVQTINADAGYTGLNEVVVNEIPNEYIIPTGTKEITSNGITNVKEYENVDVNVTYTSEEKTVTPTKEVQNVTPTSADYLSKVVVNAIPDNYIEPTGTENITANGTYDITTKASVNVNVPSEEINLQEKSISVSTNGSVEVTADAGYTGLSKVNVSNTQELEQVSVTPTTEIQTITPSENKLINQVNVSAIPSEYIIPSGTQSITSNGTYDITSKASVEVNVPGEEVVLQSKNVTPTTEIQNITADEGYDGLSSVSVSAVDNTIDSNIVSENIKNGVSILGVTGTLNEGITPSGELAITENGTYDVTNYASANVNVSSGGTGKYAPRKISFYQYSGTELDYELSNLDTSNITSMDYMFSYCSSLTSLDLSSFNTSNVTDMSYMFRNCSSLTSLDLSSLNTSNVTNMRSMFNGCSKLTSLDLSSFNTSSVTNMGYMFNGCSKLTSLDLSSFNTSNVTDMGYMFLGCLSLTTLNISNFDFTNVTTTNDMFYNVPSNCLIIVKDDTAKTLITSKFANLTNVKTVSEL